MVGKLFSILAAFLVAISLATNWQVLRELKETQSWAHLATYSSQDSSDSDHDHDVDHHSENVSGSHTHKHRHAPNEPEHDHTHLDFGFVSFAATTSVGSPDLLALLRMPPIFEVKRISNERLPSSSVLASLFRPPII